MRRSAGVWCRMADLLTLIGWYLLPGIAIGAWAVATAPEYRALFASAPPWAVALAVLRVGARWPLLLLEWVRILIREARARRERLAVLREVRALRDQANALIAAMGDHADALSSKEDPDAQ